MVFNVEATSTKFAYSSWGKESKSALKIFLRNGRLISKLTPEIPWSPTTKNFLFLPPLILIKIGFVPSIPPSK